MQTIAQHTPGPWEAKEYTNSRITGGYGVFARDSNIPIVEGAYGEDIATADANTRLIAAAPDLLAALEAVLDKPDDVTVYEAIERARAAIRKAKGE